MRNLNSVLAVALVAIGAAAPVMAQSLTLPSYMTADHNMRTSKLMGVPVYNDHNEQIGVIDDIMLPASGGAATAVLSVGGYLGTGDKMVKVPLSHVHFTSGKPMMPGGSKAALTAMPAYSYVVGGQGGG